MPLGEPELPHSLARDTAAIIVHFGDPALTAAAAASVSRGSAVPGAIVVVDNGPGDLRDEIAPAAVILRPRRNLGFGTGVMYAAAQEPARSARYLWLLNNDAEAEPGALAALLAAAAARAQPALVASVVLESASVVWSTSATYYPWLLTSRHDRQRPAMQGDFDVARDHWWLKVRYLPACSLLLPAQLLEKVGGFDPRWFLYGEDVELSLRTLTAGGSLVVAPSSVVHHRPSSGTDDASREALIAEASLRLTRIHFRWLLPLALVGGAAVGGVRAAAKRATWPLTARIAGYRAGFREPTRRAAGER